MRKYFRKPRCDRLTSNVKHLTSFCIIATPQFVVKYAEVFKLYNRYNTAEDR